MTNDGLVPGCGIAFENCKFHFRNFSARESLQPHIFRNFGGGVFNPAKPNMQIQRMFPRLCGPNELFMPL